MRGSSLFQSLGRVAAVALTVGGLLLSQLGAVAQAAPPAQPLPKPDLTQVDVKKLGYVGTDKYPYYLDITWIDKASFETGYEIVSRLVTRDGSINVTLRMLPGAIAGTEDIGHGTLVDGLKPEQRYCVTVRAINLNAVDASEIVGPKSNEICVTMPAAPVKPAPPALAPWPVLQQGAGGNAVTTLQHLLRYQGIDTVVDGDFGPQTAANVRQFQREQNLPADGIVGPPTWEKLAVNLQKGAKGEAVLALQKQLNAHGANLALDGDFGPETEQAAKAFGQAKGLPTRTTGIVTVKTWQALLGS